MKFKLEVAGYDIEKYHIKQKKAATYNLWPPNKKIVLLKTYQNSLIYLLFRYIYSVSFT